MKHIPVVSGKGGVGKTLISINIAKELSNRGFKTALIDADISNPNIGEFIKVENEIEIVNGKFKPLKFNGIEFISMSNIYSLKPVAMYASEYAQILRDLISNTEWSSEYSVIDMPATITDTFLELITTFGEELLGSIIVVQPSHVESAERVLRLHLMEGIPVIGVIENMSGFICEMHEKPVEYKIFGELNLEELCGKYNVKPLGSIPLSMEIRRNIEGGMPFIPEKYREPIKRAVEEIINAKPVETGVIERIKMKLKEIGREILVKLMATVIEIANTEIDIAGIQSKYGFKMKDTIELNITDESLRKVYLQAYFRVEDGKIKIVKNPTRIDSEIRVWDKALIWSLLGYRTDTGMPWDLMDAWLTGKLSFYSYRSGTPRALQFMREVWSSVSQSPSFTRLKKILEGLV